MVLNYARAMISIEWLKHKHKKFLNIQTSILLILTNEKKNDTFLLHYNAITIKMEFNVLNIVVDLLIIYKSNKICVCNLIICPIIL